MGCSLCCKRRRKKVSGNNRHLMFHQLSRQGRQSIVMIIRRARIVTPFLRGEICRVAYTQQRGEDHFHLSAGRVHCLPGVMEQDVTEAARRLLSESCFLSGRISLICSIDDTSIHPKKGWVSARYTSASCRRPTIAPPGNARCHYCMAPRSAWERSSSGLHTGDPDAYRMGEPRPLNQSPLRTDWRKFTQPR